ncbi:MAG: hypothetical protein GY858_08945 [Candidatus Omnitrophica bacterium]|nr:hypothetical protein [Candidatus Omnitrophota bacterium]
MTKVCQGTVLKKDVIACQTSKRSEIMDTTTNEKDIIDITTAISDEELARNFMDIKQVANFFGVNVRTAYRYLEKAEKQFGIKPAEETRPTQNGQKTKYYKIKDIREIARVLKRDANASVISGKTSESSEIIPADNSVLLDSLKGMAKMAENVEKNSQSLAKVGESFSSLSTEIAQTREDSKSMAKKLIEGLENVNGSLTRSNDMMTNVFSKIMDQGIDFKEKYLESKNVQAVNNMRAEELAKEASVKQQETIQMLLKETTAKQEEMIQKFITGNDSKKTVSFENLILTVIVIFIIMGGGVAFLVTKLNERADKKIEERIAQENQIQQSEKSQLMNELDNLKSEVNDVRNTSPWTYTPDIDKKGIEDSAEAAVESKEGKDTWGEDNSFTNNVSN